MGMSVSSNPSQIIAEAFPIGCVIAWLADYASTPALPEAWVEASGQVLSDAGSIYNGQTIPNLNGGNRFLRGNATSEGTGGATSASHNHQSPLSTNGNDLQFKASGAHGTKNSIITDRYIASSARADEASCQATSSDSVATVPPYYNVVWIMKVK